MHRMLRGYLGILLLLPIHVWSHGTELIHAWLQPEAPHLLELSIDSGDHPLVEDAASTRRALEEELIITLNGEVLDWAEIVEWSRRAGPDPDCPVPIPREEGQRHRWLVATLDLSAWQGQEFSLTVKSDSRQAVVFWLKERQVSGAETRWQILIAGDQSARVLLH